MRALPPAIIDHAERQLSLVTHAQLLEVMSRVTVHRACQAGILVPMAPGVYRLAGSTRSWRQRALAACLSVGDPVAVSGLAAAYLLRTEGIARPALELTVPGGRRSRSNVAAVHRQILPPTDIRPWDLIPATTPARTIVDLSRRVRPELLQRAYDDLVRRGLLTPAELRARLEAGLPRCDPLALADLLSRDRILGGSAKEDWIADTLVGAGFPAPERHVHVVLDGRVREIDCAYPELRIGIEYDSWAYHGDETHFHGDRDKFGLLVLAGWIAIIVTSAWDDKKLIARTQHAFDRRARERALSRQR